MESSNAAVSASSIANKTREVLDFVVQVAEDFELEEQQSEHLLDYIKLGLEDSEKFWSTNELKMKVMEMAIRYEALNTLNSLCKAGLVMQTGMMAMMD